MTVSSFKYQFVNTCFGFNLKIPILAKPTAISVIRIAIATSNRISVADVLIFNFSSAFASELDCPKPKAPPARPTNPPAFPDGL